MDDEHAKCRHCGVTLRGSPYWKGGVAYLDDGRQAPVNYYGGFVCSHSCDKDACLEMEPSMRGGGESKYLNSLERVSVWKNWKKQ